MNQMASHLSQKILNPLCLQIMPGTILSGSRLQYIPTYPLIDFSPFFVFGGSTAELNLLLWIMLLHQFCPLKLKIRMLLIIENSIEFTTTRFHRLFCIILNKSKYNWLLNWIHQLHLHQIYPRTTNPWIHPQTNPRVKANSCKFNFSNLQRVLWLQEAFFQHVKLDIFAWSKPWRHSQNGSKLRKLYLIEQFAHIGIPL